MVLYRWREIVVERRRSNIVQAVAYCLLYLVLMVFDQILALTFYTHVHASRARPTT